MDHTATPTDDRPLAPRPDAGATVSDGDLHPAVAERHERLDASAWDDIYVVGDVHGCIDELRRLMAALDPGPDDLVVFVGDLVRKGPDSKAVLEFVRERENFRSVRGNNEDKLIHGRKTLDGLDDADRRYLKSLPVAISWDDAFVVHGGVDPTRPLASQDIESLLNCRSIPAENGYDGPFWFEQYRGPPRTFFGHTVLDEPVRTEWAIGLDTGCVYGGSLTAYDWSADTVVSVPASRTYEPRADEKVLGPDRLDT
ncbi:metallophosphoesterase family protein [Halobellus sp. EA9]|uniref:metallophosphoesterase family protein n=1 Tax=Halobellus sp. EA9 TaxID=3421647 RepID=UPI003EC0A39B